MKKVLIFLSVIIISSCNIKNTTTPYKPIKQSEFLIAPLMFKENINSFLTSENPKFKSQKFLRKNIHHPEKTDTIYKFTFKKSEIFFYKSYTGNEFLLTGKVVNKQIPFKNGIRIGITKDEFVNKFSDKLNFHADSVQLKGEGTKYTFLFRKEKLKQVNIDNYFD